MDPITFLLTPVIGIVNFIGAVLFGVFNTVVTVLTFPFTLI